MLLFTITLRRSNRPLLYSHIVSGHTRCPTFWHHALFSWVCSTVTAHSIRIDTCVTKHTAACKNAPFFWTSMVVMSPFSWIISPFFSYGGGDTAFTAQWHIRSLRISSNSNVTRLRNEFYRRFLIFFRFRWLHVVMTLLRFFHHYFITVKFRFAQTNARDCYEQPGWNLMSTIKEARIFLASTMPI